uniref:Reverse transcriptase n=1 Tax=Tanacetum cinerariifolium TaxID=118510 RepID=A0A6L2NL54_TANCI|nr:reverse transcriptase [Tanacetum cinerariifolium]
MGSVTQYQSEFEKLMNRVTEISKNLLISFYISGLKPTLQHELLVSKTSLGDSFSLARVTAVRLEDQWAPSTMKTNMETTTTSGTQTLKTPTLRFVSTRQESTKPHLLPTPSKVGTNSSATPLAIKWISPAEWHESPRSLLLWGKLGTSKVHILIDNGSTHNFVQPEVVKRMNLPIMNKTPFKVPTTLPPHHSIDHHIHLYPNTNPMNVRPYRYLHYQKEEMEKVVNKMLSQGTIHYHELIEATIKDRLLILMANEMFDELGGAIIFTKLYLWARYHQIRDHQFYVKLSKCVFGAVTLKYLGNIILGRGIEIDPNKMAAVVGWPVPTSRPQVADALSRVFKEKEATTAMSMALSQPIINFLDDLKRENKTLEELCQIYKRLGQGEMLAGFRREHGLLLFRDRYYVRGESKLKELLLLEFHETSSMGHGGAKKMQGGVSSYPSLTSKIHSFFHVLILKPFSEVGHEIVANLLEEDRDGHPMEQLLVICATCIVLQNEEPGRQVLVQWLGISPEEATWKWLTEFQSTYPSYHLECYARV